MTHYPNFDVLEYIDEWDEHTREIVKKRLGPFPQNEFLTPMEANNLTKIAQHLVGDDDGSVLAWVLDHIDRTLAKGIGEKQRKATTPPQRILIRFGLKALRESSKKVYGLDFMDLDQQKQKELLGKIQQGQAPMVPAWDGVPQKDFFSRLAEIAISAYYSHPYIWSQMGFGGPAYPRGYVRIELGLTDPWEAK